jgi:hypothetical protein
MEVIMADINLTKHAIALSKKGASKGGKARAQKLTKTERQDIARHAAEARWDRVNQGKESVIPKATHGTPDHPLKIGDLEIPCYVLEDGRRMLHQRGVVSALGMGRGGSSEGRGDRLAKFTAQSRLSKFVADSLLQVTKDPIKFKTPNGSIAYGYEATILADICDAVLAARKDGLLQKQQLHIADRCEILVRGFARVGIIALVDEATGYQDVRSRQALEQILDRYIRGELGKWAKTFPDDFYKEMFRLRNWQYSPFSVKRPQYVGHITNDVVYARLAPGVLDELRRREPNISGRRKHKFFQWLTDDIGHPRLREHLVAVLALMRVSNDWHEFNRMLQRAFPKLNSNLEFPLDDR